MREGVRTLVEVRRCMREGVRTLEEVRRFEMRRCDFSGIYLTISGDNALLHSSGCYTHPVSDFPETRLPKNSPLS
jgi:hypothetical protein